MRKILKAVFIVMILLPLFSFISFGENEAEEYKNLVGDELFSSFDEEIKDALEVFGVNELENSAFDFSFESISNYFSNNLKEKASAAIKLLFEFLLLLMISAVAEMIEGKEEKDSVFSVLSVCVFSLLTAKKTYGVLNIAVTAAGAINKLMLSYVPVYAGIIAASGNPISAATYNSLTLLLAEGVSAFASKLLVPFVGVILCFTIAFSMSKVVNCGRFLSSAGKISNIGLGVAAAFFTGFLSFKNILSLAADSASTRGIRFLVSSLIPVVGSAMSDAYSAFASSINLIKGSVAVVGICAVFASCFPAVCELLLYFASLSLLSFFSEILGQNKVSLLFKGFSLAVKILTLVLVYEVFIMIISTGLVLNVRGGA